MLQADKFASREFDFLSASIRSRTNIRLGTSCDIKAVYDLIEREFKPPYAPPSAMEFAISRNRNTLCLFERNGLMIGFHAALFLSATGLERLQEGQFNALNPESTVLADERTAPAAIYIWMVIAPGLAVEGMLQIAERLRDPLYERANLYARPATAEGERLMSSFGYQPIPDRAPILYRYVRQKNRSKPRQQTA